jgi:hypothetical protein
MPTWISDGLEHDGFPRDGFNDEEDEISDMTQEQQEDSLDTRMCVRARGTFPSEGASASGGHEVATSKAKRRRRNSRATDEGASGSTGVSTASKSNSQVSAVGAATSASRSQASAVGANTSLSSSQASAGEDPIDGPATPDPRRLSAESGVFGSQPDSALRRDKRARVTTDDDNGAASRPPAGRLFSDAIHGHFELDPLCVAFVDTVEFQRLHNLRQLGVGYLVFPSASHNRFEHSIGVRTSIIHPRTHSNAASRLVSPRLRIDLACIIPPPRSRYIVSATRPIYATSPMYRHPHSRHVTCFCFCFCLFRIAVGAQTCYLAGQMVERLRDQQPELGITEVEVLCVKLAGLCHDLGHGPFSHTFEQHVRTHGDAGWSHELASKAMFRHLIAMNKLDTVLAERGVSHSQPRPSSQHLLEEI